jgi:hypothetical protein
MWVFRAIAEGKTMALFSGHNFPSFAAAHQQSKQVSVVS